MKIGIFKVPLDKLCDILNEIYIYFLTPQNYKHVFQIICKQL